MSAPGPSALVKCLVWDLDDTLWRGTLLEDPKVELRPEAAAALRALDERGVLHSIASKNDAPAALAKLEELGLSEYFLYPQISWSSKAAAVEVIARSLNLGLDALALVDDQAIEREEVRASFPQVRCYDAADAATLVDRPELSPAVVTEDAKNRRAMMQRDVVRDQAEQAFVGPKESFLASLGLQLTLRRAEEQDLRRAEELTVRTHQLNTTGLTFSYDELVHLCRSPGHDLYVASLRDRFGDYGTIGLALVEHQGPSWLLRLLLMSCRVMNRGVGTIFLWHLVERARAAGVRLLAEYAPNGRNRMMLITYAFAGFRQLSAEGPRVLLEGPGQAVQAPPPYVTLRLG